MKKLIAENVRAWLALAIPALVPVAAHAEPLTLSSSDTQSSALTAPQTVPVAQPAQNAPAPLGANGRVLVLPFLPVNPNEPSPWLGRSIQDSLVADLMVSAPDHVVKLDQPAATLEAAVALGRQNGAQYIVVGGYVSSDHEVRITGQVVDVQSGKAVTSLKVTGDTSQIFHLEDALAMQVKGQLMPGQQSQQPAPQPVQPPAQLQPTVQVPQPDYSSYASPPPQVVYGGDSANYTYYYPNYGYAPDAYDYVGWPYYGYGYSYGGGIYYGGGAFGLRHEHFDRGHISGRTGGGFVGSGFSGGGRVSTGVGGFRSSAMVHSGGFSHGGGGFHGGGAHGGGGHGGGHR